jgi:serine/threonine-protein kinase
VEFRLPPDPRIGTVLADRYRIDSLLGEGAMGKVYAAEHVMMHKRLAVKVLHRELTVVPELVARFEREAMAAANVDHPNIASATDFGKLEDESVFIALELVEGVCLRDAIAKGPIPLRRALHIVRQIAAALGAAHALSIVHRDLKPENVMLVERNGDPDFVKVLDFGVAKVPIGDPSGGPGAITRVGTVFGTPEYIPPEQALGQPSDGRADLYSLGVMLFEMLTGVRPFTSTSKVSLVGMHLSEPAPRLRDRAPGLAVPESVETLVARLLKKSPQDRPESAFEVVKAIDAILERPLFQPFDRALFTRVRDGVGARFSDARALARPPFERLVAYIDARRAALPKPLADKLAPLPARQLATVAVATAAAVVLLVIVGIAAALGGSGKARERAASRAANAAPTAPSSRVESPLSPSAGAPNPAAAHNAELDRLLELAKTRALAKDFDGAVDASSRALALDPIARSDGRVATALFQAAQNKSSLEPAFKLLEGPMGERGAGIVHDLAVFAPRDSAAQTKAEAWLGSPGFNAVAAPPLKLAVALRHARTCDEVHRLLLEVKMGGDKQSLPYLKFFHEHLNKYPCLKSDTLLDDTTKAVSARAAKLDIAAGVSPSAVGSVRAVAPAASVKR